MICPLIAPDATGITGSYDNRLVVPEVPRYKFENIGCLQGTRAPPVRYVPVVVDKMLKKSTKIPIFIPGTRLLWRR